MGLVRNDAAPGGTSEVVEQPLIPDVSGGYPVVANADATPGPIVPESGPQTPAVPQTPEPDLNAPAKPAETPEAAQDRESQRLAQNLKVLAELGVDPLSDLGEQLEKGVITGDMLRDHVFKKYQFQQQVTAGPAPVVETAVTKAEAYLAEVEAKYNQEITETQQVSLETNNQLRQAERKLSDAKLSELSTQIAADKQAVQVNENVGAVISVAHNMPEFAAMPQPQQQGIEQIMLSLTGMLADQGAKNAGMDPASLTAANYAYYAEEATKVLAGLSAHERQLGRDEATANFRPQAPQPPSYVNANQTPLPRPVTPIAPANAGGLPVIPQNPYANANAHNVRDLAKQYVAGGGQV